MTAEVWVMRVVVTIDDMRKLEDRLRVIVHGAGGGCTTDMQDITAVLARLKDGRYQVVGGDVVEPIECIEVPPGGDMERAQLVANERAVAAHKRTGCVHKVVMSADL